MADFARSQLLKYGWTEGKGLGKYENGIAEALKPKLKFDTAGVGHDASEYHWWEFVYNKASSNININTESQDVQIKVNDKNAVDIKTSKSELNLGKIKREQELHYGSFIKTSTLEDGKVTTNPDYSVGKCDTEGETSPFTVLNDENLFKACGGRTAHKGARHGMRLNGKLARIERQEKNLLVRLKGMKNITECDQVEKKKKSEKNQSINVDAVNEADRLIQKTVVQSILIPNTADHSSDYTYYYLAPAKKTRRKAKRQVENLTHFMKTSLTLCNDVPADYEKKKSDVFEGDESFKKAEKNLKRKKLHGDTLKCKNIMDNEDTGIAKNVEYMIEPTMKKCKREVLEASLLNSKIEKKKRNKKAKKDRKILEKISADLEKLDFIETNSTNDKPGDESKAPKKKKKKEKPNN